MGGTVGVLGWARAWATCLRPVLALTTAAALGLLAGSCSDPCCTTDGFPINLEPAKNNGTTGLIADFQYAGAAPDGVPQRMSIDTGTALTFVRRQAEGNQIVLRDFDLLDATLPTSQVVRGKFHAIEVLPLPLDPTGADAVLGGQFLQNFSVQFDFGKPSLTFWPRQGASDGFLAAAGFAVIHFNPMGGAELTAESRPDFLGLTGPVEVPPTRVVLRACAGADAFDPDSAPEALCCKRGDEVALASGANLALVVSTGVGPLVLSRSAWDRVAAVQETPPADPVPGATLSIPSLPEPLTAVLWSTLPRLALVNQELEDSMNPGACIELGRARRLEWVEHHQKENACVLPCDTDPRDSRKAQNSAAYLEVAGTITVAIVPDGTPLLQGLRAEIRPEGPEIDGLVGADVFAQTTMELDYRSQPARAIVECLPSAIRSTCYVAPRCPRLSDPGDMRACFGQFSRALPLTCGPSVCG